MYGKRFEKETFKTAVKDNVKTLYRKTIDEATPQQIFQAVSYAVKEVIIDDWLATQKAYDEADAKTVYYMSMEFLMGRALGTVSYTHLIWSQRLQLWMRKTGQDLLCTHIKAKM